MCATYLFLPSHERRKAVRAAASGVHAVVFDLEAAVPPGHKDVGRRAVGEYLDDLMRPDGPEFWVRVNSSGPELAADIEGLDWSRLDGAVVAQSEDPAVLAKLEAAGVKRLLPMIESARAFQVLDRLASFRTVERFALGTWDLLVDLGLLAVTDPDESELVWQLRGQLVLASRQLGLASPIDGVCASLDDDERFSRLCRRVRQLGYAGKMLVHPKQIPLAAKVFGPDEERLQFAREVVAEYERAVDRGAGVARVRGSMIDRPMVEQARALLARWSATATF